MRRSISGQRGRIEASFFLAGRVFPPRTLPIVGQFVARQPFPAVGGPRTRGCPRLVGYISAVAGKRTDGGGGRSAIKLTIAEGAARTRT